MVRRAAALFCCAAMVAVATGQVDAPAGKPKQGIQGKVVDARSGEPIRKVNVQLLGQSEGAQGTYSMLTGTDGGFAFDGMSPGPYLVMLQKAGYVQITNVEKRLILEAGQSLNVVFRMQAAGIIVGKIVDPEGDPIAQVGVSASIEGRRSVMARGSNGGNATTNDLGEYRISDLRPGKYLVLARPPSRGAVVNEMAGGKSKERLVPVATYYPGTAEKGQAIEVQVRGGEEVPANFGVVMSRTYRVTGTVIGAPSGALVQQLMLESKNGSHEVVDANEQLREGGKFEYRDLLPGAYQATLVSVKGPLTGKQPEIQVMPLSPAIEVEKADVDGLELHAIPGGRVRGKFRLDSGEKFDWTQIAVTVRPTAEGSALGAMGLQQGNGNAGVNADGSFEMNNVPAGNYELMVIASGHGRDALADYYTKSVMSAGNDVADSGFAVSGDVYLDVVVSAKGARVEGVAVDSKGQLVPDVEVVAVPNTEKRMRPDAYQEQRTDEQGHFAMRGLNPGKYVVLAFEELQDDYRQPGILKAYAGKGEPVELEEGGKKSVTAKVIPAEEEQ